MRARVRKWSRRVRAGAGGCAPMRAECARESGPRMRAGESGYDQGRASGGSRTCSEVVDRPILYWKGRVGLIFNPQVVYHTSVVDEGRRGSTTARPR